MRIKVLTVTEATAYIQRIFKSDPILGHMSLQGEVSNFKLHGTGNMYFTLKDDVARIHCVCFKSNASDLSFVPVDGMHVMVKGAIQVYEREGKYQLYVKSMEEAGTGDLYHRFEQMKNELQRLGYFEQSHKKPLPTFPKKIALITSPTGAAVQDMISVFKRKQPRAEIVILPSVVQGNDAAQQLAKAIGLAHEMGFDLIVLARGGGSIEELWAFNERILADAIYKSPIPIISGVGHETDFTIADFVCDYRAPTPTGAAEASCVSRQEMRETLDQLYDSVVLYMERFLEQKIQGLQSINITRQALSLNRFVDVKANVLNYEFKQLKSAMNSRLSLVAHQLEVAGGGISANNPLLPLEKGYALLYKNNQVISPLERLGEDSTIQLKRLKSTAYCQVLKEEING